MYRLLLAATLVAAAPLLMAPGAAGCPDCHEHWTEAGMTVGTEKHYSFTVIAGQRYDIVLRPSAGDTDLYTGDDPSIGLSNFDCRPYLNGTVEEVCTLTPTSSGTQYVMVHVYSGTADWNLWVIESDTGCHSGSAGSANHCAATCRCGYELGHCDDDDECGGGLECVANAGGAYGWGSTVGVCL